MDDSDSIILFAFLPDGCLLSTHWRCTHVEITYTKDTTEAKLILGEEDSHKEQGLPMDWQSGQLHRC